MFKLLRRFTWVGGVVAASRTPAGRRAIQRVKTYANDPATRRKLADLRGRYLPASHPK